MGTRGLRVHPDDPGVGEGGQHERGMEHAGKLDVVEVLRGADGLFRRIFARQPGTHGAEIPGCQRLHHLTLGVAIAIASTIFT